MEDGVAPAARLAPGFQPEIVPSSVAKMNAAGKPAGVPLSSRKSVELPLKTTPVGVDCVPSKPRRRDDDEIAWNAAGFREDVDGISRAAVKARGAGIVVADPEGAAGTSGRGGRTSEPPGILQVRVHDRRHALNVRDEVRLFVMLRLRYSGE